MIDTTAMRRFCTGLRAAARATAARAVALGALALVCAGAFSPQSADARDAATLEAEVDVTLVELFRIEPSLRTIYDNAYGVLVMPDVIKGGFVVGGTYGEGALVIGGRVDSFWRFVGGSVGFQAGAQTTSRVMFFMTPTALTNFLISEGASVGADAEVTVIDSGAQVTVDTRTSTQPVILVVFSRQGLLGGASVQGGRYSRFNPS